MGQHVVAMVGRIATNNFIFPHISSPISLKRVVAVQILFDMFLLLIFLFLFSKKIHHPITIYDILFFFNLIFNFLIFF
jgi:hypothetical protein